MFKTLNVYLFTHTLIHWSYTCGYNYVCMYVWMDGWMDGWMAGWIKLQHI